MPPSLDSLRCFAEAARSLNFRHAARQVALSPAALGQRIRQLEDGLGATLFQRTTRSVVLTEAGRSLVPHARRVLDAARDCRLAVHGELGRAPEEIVLGTRQELGLSWVMPVRRKVGALLPHVTVHLYFSSGEDLVARVRMLDIDCAITSTRLSDPKLEAINLHEERYVFVGGPRLLARHPLRRARDARAHTLVDTTQELPLFRYWRDAVGGVDSLRFGRVLRMGTIAAMRDLVLAGGGVAVLPEYFVRRDLRARRLKIIMPRVKPTSDFFRLVFRADDSRRVFFTQLAQIMGKEPLR